MFNEEHPLEILVDSASEERYSKLVLRDNTDGSIQVGWPNGCVCMLRWMYAQAHRHTLMHAQTHTHTVNAILPFLLSVVWVFSARTEQLFSDATERRTASRQGGTHTTSLTDWVERKLHEGLLPTLLSCSQRQACSAHVQPRPSHWLFSLLSPSSLCVSQSSNLSLSLPTAARQVHNMEENLARSYARKVFAGSRDCRKVADGPSPPAADPCALTPHAPTGI